MPEIREKSTEKLKWYQPDKRVKLGCIVLPIAIILLIPFVILSYFLQNNLNLSQPLIVTIPAYIATLIPIKKLIDKKGIL